MGMGMGHVHAISFNRARHSADEHNGAVRLHCLDDAHMGQGIVETAISIEIPRIVKKYEIAGAYDWTTVELSMGANMIVDEAYAVGCAVYRASLIEIDSMGEVNGSSYAGAIVSNAASIALDRACADEVDEIAVMAVIDYAATAGKAYTRGTFSSGYVRDVTLRFIATRPQP